jgi:hypothetical protein
MIDSVEVVAPPFTQVDAIIEDLTQKNSPKIEAKELRKTS